MSPLISNVPSSESSSMSSCSRDKNKPIMATVSSGHCLPHRTDAGNIRSVSDSALHATTDSVMSPLLQDDSGSQGDNDFTSLTYKPKRRISFDERVSVREFQRNSWHMIHDSEQLSPIGGGRTVINPVPEVIVCPQGPQQHSLSFPHYLPSPPSSPRNKTTIHHDINSNSNSNSDASYTLLQGLLQHEIRRVLMVDPHDIFLTLFSKRLQQAMVHVQIFTAHSSEEALELCARQSFDMIITEERLSLFHRHTGGPKIASGSALLGHLRLHSPKQFQHALLIGVSAHWQSDHATMVKSGADYCWSKAPAPTLNQSVLEELLHTLLLKRGRHEAAKTMMVMSSSGMAAVPGLSAPSSSPPTPIQVQ